MESKKEEFILTSLQEDKLLVRDLAAPLLIELAKSERLTSSIVKKLLGINEEQGSSLQWIDLTSFFRALGANKGVPIKQLATAGNEMALVEGILSRKERLSPELFGQIFEKAKFQTKCILLDLEEVPLEVIERVVADPNSSSGELYRLALNPITPVEQLRKLLKSTHSGVISAAIENPNLEISDVESFAKNGQAKIRTALAKRADISKLSEESLELLLGDNSDDVRQALAGNAKLDSSFAVQFLTDSSNAVRYDAIAFGNLPVEKLIPFATSSKAMERRLVLLNPNLPITMKFQVAAEGLEVLNKGTDAAKNRRKLSPTGFPPEISFWLRKEIKELGQIPGNLELAKEIRGWERDKGQSNKGVFLTSTNSPDFVWQIAGTTVGGPDWVALRWGSGELWQLFIEDLNNLQRPERIMEVVLPKAVDGWEVGFNIVGTENFLLSGCSPSPRGKAFFWWCLSKPLEKKGLLKLPNLSGSYPGVERLSKKTAVEVHLVCSVLVDGALLALWRDELGEIGWTLESNARKIKRTRKLTLLDLVPAYILNNKISRFEGIVRKVTSKAISL